MIAATETFEQFVERMSQVEKSDEFVIGRASSGNSRAVFMFEGHQCCLESFGYRSIPDAQLRSGKATLAQRMWVATAQPHDTWVLSDWVRGKSAAWKLAQRYGGQACPDEYHEDDKDAWYLRFHGDDAFEKMLKLVWDYQTGVLPRDTFPWKDEENKEADNE